MAGALVFFVLSGKDGGTPPSAKPVAVPAAAPVADPPSAAQPDPAPIPVAPPVAAIPAVVTVSIEGPPAEAGQSLPRYPLKVLNGLLYIEVTTETLTGDAGGDEASGGGAGVIDEPEGPPGPGHDPCLFPDFQRRAKSERHV